MKKSVSGKFGGIGFHPFYISCAGECDSIVNLSEVCGLTARTVLIG